jgi:hypothetical protein
MTIKESSVIPAQAGIQNPPGISLDPRLRGDDNKREQRHSGALLHGRSLVEQCSRARG